MARRDINEAAEKYKSNSANYFKLENDRDVAVVRFLIEGELVFEEDWFIAHKIQIGGKDRWVRCSERSDCPGCKRGPKAEMKLFLQLVTKDDGERKLWERGPQFVPTINEAISKNGDLCNRPYEIERQGATGSKKTKYVLFPLDRDDKELRDIPVEKQKLMGPVGEETYFVLDLTNEEFEDALDGRLRLPSDRDNRDQRAPHERNRDRGRDDRGGSDRGRDSRGRDDRDGRDRDERDPRGDRSESDRGGSERSSRREYRSNTDVF